MCISEAPEEIFLKVYNQTYFNKSNLTLVDFGGIFNYCNKCDTECHIFLIKVIGCFVNVLLNDYNIYKMNQNASAKVERKLSKLN